MILSLCVSLSHNSQCDTHIYGIISVHFASYFFGSQTILEAKNRGLNNCEEKGNSSLKINYADEVS